MPSFFPVIASSVKVLIPRGPGTSLLAATVTNAAPLVATDLDAHYLREAYVRAGVLSETGASVFPADTVVIPNLIIV